MNNQSERIVSVLEAFVSNHKRKLIEQVLQVRTRHVTLVFEDIDKPYNISAVIRTAECLGVQDLHFIKNRNEYSVNRHIAQGAAKWVTFHHYNEEGGNIDRCYHHLRNDSYKIYVTSLREPSGTVNELSEEEKIAIVFGTEVSVVTEEAGAKADGYVHIPMGGFTESLNLSVSATICLNTLRHKHRGVFPGMTAREQMDLRAEWYRKIVRKADIILRHEGIMI